MDISTTKVVPHPQLQSALFACKSETSGIFNDVLGLHHINHIAVTQVSPQQELLIFSSTPAMEFNLFQSKLWCFDRTYCSYWFQRCTQANWQKLYDPKRYDELYYLKQIKHHYSIGYSFAVKLGDDFYIYSLASTRSCEKTQELFTHQFADFYKIGHYCVHRLKPFFRRFKLDS